MAAILNFRQQMEKHKFASISLTVEGHLKFLPKIEKHILASISLTMRDRFRRNFRPPGCPESTGDFSQNHCPATFGSHLEFFCMKCKNTNLGNNKR